MTSIYYNGANPFSGISPTPLVGRQVQMIQVGDRWGELETLTLKGIITGKCPNFNTLVGYQQSLVGSFSEDFQPFQIYDGSTLVFERDYTKLSNISFSQSDYSYGIPYDITLQSYPSGYFSGTYGILDPKEQFTFSDSRDGVMTINHLISARGFNTSATESNAVSNARSWVQSRTGFSSQILPIFTNVSGFTPALTTSVESINRLAGTYEVRETYTADLLLAGSGIMRWTVDCNYTAENGFYTVEVKGDIIGVKAGTIGALRARYAAFNAYNEAYAKLYQIIGSQAYLNTVPTTLVVTEDEAHLRLGFSYTYTSNAYSIPYFDVKIEFQYSPEDDIITAKVEGVIRSNTDISVRWPQLVSFANSINLFQTIIGPYQTYSNSLSGVSLYPLNPIEDSFTRIDNPYLYEISLSASFSNEPIPPNGLLVWDYSLQFEPALEQYSAVPCLQGQGSYNIFDLGYVTRMKLGIKGEAIGDSTSSISQVASIVQGQCEAIQQTYLTGNRPNLDAQSLTQGDSAFGLAQSVEAKYSAEAPAFYYNGAFSV